MRGRVTIPKKIRDRFGLRPGTEVEFQIHGGSIVLTKAPRTLNLAKWKGWCAEEVRKLGYTSVDRFMGAIRGCGR